MSAELAHQKADKHLCVALHRKMRLGYTLLRNLFVALETENYAEITPKLLVYCKKILKSDTLCPLAPLTLPPET